MIATHYALLPSVRFLQVWRRHFLVWRKTAASSLVANLGEPFLYLLGLGYGLGQFVGSMENVPYPVYLTAGILSANAMNAATFEAIYGGFTRMTRQNTYHAMLATPLRVADIVAGEVCWAATKSLISGTAILLVAGFMGAIPAKSAILALPVVFLAGLVFGSMGMIMTALSPSYDSFMYYFTLVTTPMFLFCGVFYPVEALPPLARTASQLLPLTHVVALIRPLTAGISPHHPLLHLLALSAFAILAFLLAVTGIRRRIII
ncbi:MAG: ABC transporter permease [Magnetococcales bacterium]|nr:ABC transporter permease [Magnetococcales bacterium]